MSFWKLKSPSSKVGLAYTHFCLVTKILNVNVVIKQMQIGFLFISYLDKYCVRHVLVWMDAFYWTSFGTVEKTHLPTAIIA